MTRELGIRSRNRIQPVFCRPISNGMVIRRRLDSGLTKNERFEARDGGVLPSASFVRGGGEGGGDSFIILASEETEMHWPPETEAEKKERESILGEGLDGPTEGRTGPAAECHSI